MMERQCRSSRSSSSIARWASAVLIACIAKVNRWARSLESRAEARAGRTGSIPVYDIIEAGPNHRYCVGHTIIANCELGLGYAMSWPKFMDTCKTAGLELEALPVDQWPDLASDRRLRFMLRNVAHVKGDFYTGENVKHVGQLLTAKRIVEDWRRANQKTCDFWAMLAQKFKDRAIAGKDTVAFRMPSGRVKRYYNPQFVKEPTIIVDDDGKERQDYRVAIAAQTVRGGPMNYFTGGSLAENLTQACCRDILMNAIVEIADTHPAWKYVWNVYDECIFQVPDSDTEEAQAEIPRIMTEGERIREWTEGLMLEVEGDICDHYHK